MKILLSVLSICLLVAGQCLAAVETPHTVAEKIASLQPTADLHYQYAEKAQVGPLLDSLQKITADADLPVTSREYLLHEGILALSKVEPNAELETWLAGFYDAPVVAWLKLEDEHGNAVVPLYDLAAAARLTRHNWDTASVRKAVTAQLSSGAWQSSREAAMSDSVTDAAFIEGTVRAFAAMDPAVVFRYRDQLVHAGQHGGLDDRIVHAAARRSTDAGLYAYLLESAGKTTALNAIASLPLVFDKATAAGLLETAISRPEIASAAVLELGHLATGSSQSLTRLLDLLADNELGSSAALALARNSSPLVLQALQDQVLSADDEIAALRAALALRLSESVAARSMRNSLLAREIPFSSVKEALR